MVVDQNVWNQRDPGTFLGPRSNLVWKPVVCAVQRHVRRRRAVPGQRVRHRHRRSDATFFDPHANGAIVSAAEPIGMLQRGVPLGDVLRWALMGTEERITADTALRLGLVSEVVPAEDLWPRAAAIAAQIAGRDPIAIQGTVRAIWESLEMPRAHRQGERASPTPTSATGRRPSAVRRHA